MLQHHYTDTVGFHAVRSQVVWNFQASQPPGQHPFGAYFTTLPPETKNLARKLGIPVSKLAYVFRFVDAGDLTPLPGGRGDYVFYSPVDYPVDEPRQIGCGPT